jgi:deferrochelatase/peroxidase EfeB
MTRRRTVLTGTLAATAAVMGGCDVRGTGASGRPAAQPAGRHVPADGHQLGVVTPPPDAAVLCGLDVHARDLRSLLHTLTRTASSVNAEITVAFGTSLFDSRFGLARSRPRRLTQMPSFPGDVLDPARCHGDLLVQVGAPTRAAALAGYERIRRAGGAALNERWRVDGFRAENGTTPAGLPSTRNLFGFREGAGNPDPRDAALMDHVVWVPPDSDEPEWAVGGTYQVVRLIRLSLALWDTESTAQQEAVFGRRKADGVALGCRQEDEQPDLVHDPDGRIIALDAHVRRANPRTPGSEANRILRRGYSYRNGPDSTGNPDEGLVFVCFQQDIERGFATVQRRLAGEPLGQYSMPIGGGYFFVPPAPTGAGEYLGSRLLAAA